MDQTQRRILAFVRVLRKRKLPPDVRVILVANMLVEHYGREEALVIAAHFGMTRVTTQL